MAFSIMLQGTSSNVGKSIVTTALCRILKQDGYRPVPFKAQNMALNSYVTKTGGEMGRAQVAQAEAAGLEPDVLMNPVLLKPTGNSSSQIIVMGKAVGTMSAKDYHQGYSLQALDVVRQALEKLQAEYDVLVIEGAGSPAEVNLKANDIVNMRVAKMIGAPVLLIADIDRGGALASVVGTLELLEPEERDLVKGIVINKFRGDIKLLEPALTFLEEKTGKPVVGVLPYLDNHGIDDEDSVVLDEKSSIKNSELDIAVIRLPKISNFTDFDALARENVSLRYVKGVANLGKPDLIILPGSKNTTEDLLFLKESGLEKEIIKLHKSGTPVIGICGGYQMLGREVQDPEHSESDLDSLPGLNLLPVVTVFEAEKVTRQVKVQAQGHDFLGMDFSGQNLTGYEIHSGRTSYLEEQVNTAFKVDRFDEQGVSDGAISDNKLVLGTYVHGIFDNDEWRAQLIKALYKHKGLDMDNAPTINIQELKEQAYNNLAEQVRKNMDMQKLYAIIGFEECDNAK